ncbi:MAG: 2Fe-2S iron-sulfur cluster binding domain-containing protein [Novosphingobium sp.]
MGAKSFPGSAVKVWSARLDGEEQAVACRSDENLLQALIAARRTAVKVGCRGGGCGVCRIKVVQGTYESQKMTRSRISAEDEAAGIVLACRILPQSDLTVIPLALTAGRSAA